MCYPISDPFSVLTLGNIAQLHITFWQPEHVVNIFEVEPNVVDIET